MIAAHKRGIAYAKAIPGLRDMAVMNDARPLFADGELVDAFVAGYRGQELRRMGEECAAEYVRQYGDK